MKKGLILLFSIFYTIIHVQAYELMYPCDKKIATTSDYAFFFGKAKSFETLSINGEHIYIAPNGAFAHTVKLKDGENRILLRNAYGSIQMFKYYKTAVNNKEFPIEDFDPKIVAVKNNNTPLRKTPIDAGLNRIAHLFEGTTLIINGSKGNFYRVFLDKNSTGWIAKDQVEPKNINSVEAPEFITMNSERYKNAMLQTISFTDKLPYTVQDNKKEIIFRVYNPLYSEKSVYNLSIPKPEKYVYSISSEDGKYNFKVKEIPDDIKDITVVIDAGHGGSEKGAIGCLGDEEKNINLKIAKELYSLLKNKDINVIMTRECDGNLSLQDRIAIAKENNADIFVSIHLNSIGNIPMDIHKTRGTSVYYYNNNAKDLASSVLKHITNSAGTRDDGLRTASFAVIRPSEYVGILVESAYMTNPLDSMMYTNDKFLHKIAEGISEGIEEYIKK